MSSISIAGDVSGAVSLVAPSIAGTTTLNLPASSGTILDDASVGVCRAWVNFNGTGIVAIRASFNVSSITDNGVGDYTVNFTTAMPDANYGIAGFCRLSGATSVLGLYGGANFSQLTTSLRIQTATTANVNPTVVSASIFR